MSKVVEQHIPCPSCPSSDAYCLYDDGHGYCYSCNYLYQPEKDDGIDEGHTFEFLSWRHVTRDTCRHYGVKNKISKDGKPIAIGFPYPNGATKVRLLDKKEFYWQGSHTSGLFGTDRFASGSHSFVIITEGELDALSLYQVTRYPVVSVQSAASAESDCVASHEWLSGFDQVYLAFDNDTAGREATRRVARLFDYNKVRIVKFTNRKDANDYLERSEGDVLLNLVANAKCYLPETVVSSFSEFRDILRSADKRGISYPFPTLTEKTYGIRTGEIALITAQEGVGKTEIMHAIEHHILKETDDNVGAIFLEEPKQRHLQAIAGLELRLPVHLPDCNCTEDQVFAALEKAVGKDERLHVYSHFGSSDPEVLLDTIRFLVSARKCKYILLDHITMAVSGLAEQDERRALDVICTKLDMMVQELDYALIMVSHVNDLGQTRGSRYIGKIAHIRIDATRDLSSSSDLDRNITYLSVAKNRFSGKTGPAGKIIFDPKTFTMKEDVDESWQTEQSPSTSPPETHEESREEAQS